MDENIAGSDVAMTTKQKTSFLIFDGDKKNSVVARSSVVKPNHANRVTEEFSLRSDTTVPIIRVNLVTIQENTQNESGRAKSIPPMQEQQEIHCEES